MLVSVVIPLFLSHVSLVVLVDVFHVCAIVGWIARVRSSWRQVQDVSRGVSVSDHLRLVFCVTMSTMLGGARVFTGKSGFGLGVA